MPRAGIIQTCFPPSLSGSGECQALAANAKREGGPPTNTHLVRPSEGERLALGNVISRRPPRTLELTLTDHSRARGHIPRVTRIGEEERRRHLPSSGTDVTAGIPVVVADVDVPCCIRLCPASKRAGLALPAPVLAVLGPHVLPLTPSAGTAKEDKKARLIVPR